MQENVLYWFLATIHMQ